MSETERIHVASEEEFEDGDRRIVSIGDDSIGVFNIDGEYFALKNECPHQGGPVCTGRVGGELVAEYRDPGKRVKERISNNPVVACPWHGWEYDVETGTHLGDDSIRLPTYTVVVKDNEVYIEV
jgi:nitrite reductase (NADH) small subunit